MKTKLYASLMGPLLGMYYPLPFDDEGKCRVALNSSSLAKLWCSVYTSKVVDESIAKYGGIKLPDEYARKLDYDSHVVEVGCSDTW